VRVELLVVLVGVGACAFEWDGFDPRLGGPVGEGGSAAGGGSEGGGGGGPGGSGAWFDEGLLLRRPVEVALSGAGDAELEDFPVLVVVPATAELSPGLRFVADDHATLLAHEIELFDARDETLVWVRVPLLSATTRTLWLYYGGTPISMPRDPAETWSNGFVAVWHLGAELVDSTGHGHDGSGNAAVAAGRIGLGRGFDGDGDFVDVAPAAVFDGLFAAGGTISVFVAPATAGEVDRGRILDRTVNSTFGGGFALLMSSFATPGSVGFGYGWSDVFGWWTTPQDSVVFGAWQHVAVSYAEVDAAPDLYLDGLAQAVVVDGTPAGAAPTSTNVPVRIGGRSGGADRDFDGIIDELRVASGVRSPLWIAAEALSADGALATVGEPEE
jgi:hypothetical protein